MKAGRSISSQLTIWFSSVLFVTLVLFGAIMWFNLDHTLMTGRERTLDRRAERLGELLRAIQSEPPAVGEKKFLGFAEATGGGLIQVFQTNGTPELPSASAADSFPWPKFAAVNRDRFEEVSLSGQPYLVLTRPFSAGSRPLILRVAAPLEGNRPVLHAFSIGLFWTAPALLILSALGGYTLSRRALKPVDQITEAARSITLSNLSERLPVPTTGDELQRLSETHNAMLARLETAVNEIKRFTSDASHELRTPLSFVRTVAELALRNSQADPASRGAFEEIVEECGKAGRLLEDMLTLARADAGHAQMVFEPVDVAGLVSAVCEKVRPLAAAREHSFVLSVENSSSATVWADYSSLRRLIWILLENALKYTPSPGRVQATVKDGDREVIVAVEDNGIGISATDLPHIFQRFYRADPSRSQVEGTGLGLAIAKWIVDAHRARIWVESTAQGGSVFHVGFPVFEDAGGHSSPRFGGSQKVARSVLSGL